MDRLAFWQGRWQSCQMLQIIGIGLAVVALAAGSLANAAEARLLGGKLSLQIAEGWKEDTKDSPTKIGAWERKPAWGAIVRGTRGLKPNALASYKDAKVAEYSKGLEWLPNLKWLKKELVKRNGRTWADLRFIGLRDGARSDRDGLLYTRILATSYQGQLLEVSFTANTDEDVKTQEAIDRMVDSVKLHE